MPPLMMHHRGERVHPMTLFAAEGGAAGSSRMEHKLSPSRNRQEYLLTLTAFTKSISQLRVLTASFWQVPQERVPHRPSISSKKSFTLSFAGARVQRTLSRQRCGGIKPGGQIDAAIIRSSCASYGGDEGGSIHLL